MNYQEMIERLRDEHIAVSCTEIVGCIESLVKERDELGRKLNTARYGQPDFAWSIHEEAMADLRVKLAKAVEALRWYAQQAADCRKITKDGDIARHKLDRDGGNKASAVLAELEGKE